MKNTKCEVCGKENKSPRALSAHVQNAHGLKGDEYTWKYVLKLPERPVCSVEGCNGEVRYHNYSFKKYCKDHARLGMSEGGKGTKLKEAIPQKGNVEHEIPQYDTASNMTFNPRWRAGLTKDDHPGILSQSKKVSGENNHFYKNPSKGNTISLFDFSKLVVVAKTKYNKTIRTSHSEYKKDYILSIHCDSCGFEYQEDLQTFKRTFKCPECEKKMSITKEIFLKRATELYQEQYEYFVDSSKFLNNDAPVRIKCKKHKEVFEQSPRNHFRGTGCKVCAYEDLSKKLRKAPGDFIEQASKIHNDKYVYPSLEQEYQNSRSEITITCPEHGNFSKVASRHLFDKTGCPKCSAAGFSKEEKEVLDFVKSFYSGEILENTRSVIPPKELDIYIPEKQFAIEYNGLYWHSGDKVDKFSHRDKTRDCKEKGIRLFHIFSDEWREKQDIVKSMIRYRMGMVPNKVFARKCEVREVDKDVGRDFFNRTHISGDTRARVYFGLYYKDNLVSCVSLKKPIQKKHGNILEIARFATELDTAVIGGFSKLYKHMKHYTIQNEFAGIMTYADRRFGDGGVYNLGEFQKTGTTPVDYWYTDGFVRHFRFKYRAQKPLTEREVADKAGVYPVYGCGSERYIVYYD